VLPEEEIGDDCERETQNGQGQSDHRDDGQGQLVVARYVVLLAVEVLQHGQVGRAMCLFRDATRTSR